MMNKLKSELDAIKKNVSSFEKVVSQGFDERNLDMEYEMQKMRYEAGFNARNIIFLLLILSTLMSQLLFGWAIYRYFEFENQNTERYIEVQNVSDNNSMVLNSVNKENSNGNIF